MFLFPLRVWGTLGPSGERLGGGWKIHTVLYYPGHVIIVQSIELGVGVERGGGDLRWRMADGEMERRRE